MGHRTLLLAVGLAVWAASLLSPGIRPAAAQRLPSVADVYVAKAVLAYEEKRYDEALSLLQEALREDPESLDAMYYTGLVYIAQRRFDLAVEILEKGRAKAPGDLYILFQLGVAYFAQENYDKAEPLLTQVFAREPRTDSLGYYVGFMRYRKKDYQGALRAFQAGTSTDPDIQQLTRIYTGLSLAILGLPGRAAAEVEEALRLRPTSALTGPAERLRDTILAAREREHRFRGEVRLGVLGDTNVAVVPEPSHDPTAEQLRLLKHHSPGELGTVRLEYSWLRTGPWEATLAYTFFRTQNVDLPKFNITNHLFATSALYRGAVAAMPYQLGLQYAYDFLTLGGDLFLTRHTVTLAPTLVENANNLTSFQARFQAKDFAKDPDIRQEVRDGNNWMVGVTHVFRFQEDRHFIRLGFQFDSEDTDGRDFRYFGNRYLAGAQYTLPWGETRLVYDMDLHLRNYPHRNAILPVEAPETKKRVDSELTHVFRAEQPLPRNLTLSLEYQAIIARSNLPVFSFNRNVYTLILSWQF